MRQCAVSHGEAPLEAEINFLAHVGERDARNRKIAVVPVTLMLALFIAVPNLGSLVGILVPVGVLVAMGSARILYKKGLL